MKKLILTTAALALTAGMGMAETVRLGTEGAYAPWNFINDNGDLDGFEIEMGNEVCKRAGLTCEWVMNDWDSIIPNLVSGNYDAIIAGMSVTAERDEVIDFSEEYTPADPSVYLASDPDLDVTAGAVIAAQTATIQAGFVADQGWDLVEFPTSEETVSAVRNGEADAVLGDDGYLTPFAEEDGLYLLERTEVIGGGVAFGLRESDGELKEKLNGAIASMKADGSLNALIEKWEVAEKW